MPSPSHVLRMESLERRENPATLSPAVGSAWADTTALTLSFAPDGTPVGGSKSDLSAVMASTGKPAEWQREVLRAFQTWAAATNANVAVVADGGQAFGTSGDRQGDNRFGDIRIGAAELSDDSLANAAPVDPTVGTWSGDVLFNSTKRFARNPSGPGGRYDVYTTALHEAGHVFGLDHADDPRSAMTERYTGVKVGLTPGDAAALRAVYGTRPPDEHEGFRGNGTFQTATRLTVGKGKFATFGGDLTTIGDVDVYSFTASGKSKQAAITVSTAGVSAAEVVVEVYDSAGRLLTRGQPTDPLRPQDFTFTLPQSKKDADYFVRVLSPAADAFAIGRYELTVNLDLKKNSGVAAEEESADSGFNNTILTAADLPERSNGNRNRFGTAASLDGARDVDTYRVRAPLVNVRDALHVQVWTTGQTAATPAVDVYDAFGHKLVAQVIESKGNKVTVQVLGVQRGASYVIAVRSPDGKDATGTYRLSAEFTDPVARGMTALASGVFTSLAPTETGTLTVESARLVNLSFSVAPLPKDVTAALRLLDADGRLVGEWEVNPLTGQATASEILRAGVYTVELSVRSLTGQPLPSIGYWLFGSISSDPIGPTAPSTGTLPGTTSPPTSPPPAPPPPSYTYTGGTKPTTTTVGYGYKS